ncbi:hypothetical protein EZV62_002833 [Acer yangbiense]|uniref:non-specific serine/threonine protein kinase n=1 Tax=Acer yangbiense TaxID=1000413 RepID=A0A5C7IZC3_9ROSI|nr:hypothetical protein EZV62_002833 [Acer yangbiense]
MNKRHDQTTVSKGPQALQMRRSPSPSSLALSSSNQTKNESETNHGHGVVAIKHQHKKTLPALNFIIVAAKKVTGVFRVFFTGKKKANPVPEGGNSEVRKPFCKSVISFRISIQLRRGVHGHRIPIVLQVPWGDRDGSIVAVKRARKTKSDQSILLEFKNEILTLSKIEHLNLVRLLGYVEDKDERIMVMEYVGNGNLREHLDGKRGNGLEIAELLDIAIDAIQKLKAGDAIIVMDPRLRRSPASTMAVEKVLKLAHRCLAPSRQSRPAMTNCAEVLWGIRKDVRERALSSSAAAASTSHHSANYPIGNAQEKRRTSFGIHDGENYNKFISA